MKHSNSFDSKRRVLTCELTRGVCEQPLNAALHTKPDER
jgi:hypothetical protein